MKTLHANFREFQNDVYDKKPLYPNSAKTLKCLQKANEQVIRIQNSDDFSNFQQVVFYKAKFQDLHDTTIKYQAKQMPKDVYQHNVREILAKDYLGVSLTQSKMMDTRKSKQPLTVPAVSGLRTKSKSPLKQFFDDQEMKNSKKKVMFSSLLSREQTPLKYGLRSTHRSRSPVNGNMNEAQLRRLKQQNDRLRNQLDADRSVHSNDDRLRQLRSQISDLSEQNRRLKVEVSSRSGPRTDYLPQEEYDPYTIKTRENNIMRINSRNLSMSEKSSQYGEEQRGYKGERIYFDNQSELAKSEFTHNPMHYSVTRKMQQPSESDLLNSSHSTIQTQLLNLDQSEIQDQEKNHVCREKIAFFKKSMVLYKNPNFDIAFKRSDLNTELDRLRIILYVNNKLPTKVQCKVEFDYQRDDFDLIVKKKLERVEGRGQGREEIEVTLRNATDLGSLITAKVLVGSVMKKILIPALFIDFDANYKHNFENIGYIERNLAQPLTIKPMGQFSNIQYASNILQLSQEYDNGHYPMAKLYGKSKVTKGIVRLTWKKDKLRIETCEEWRTLIGYLFLNTEETISY